MRMPLLRLCLTICAASMLTSCVTSPSPEEMQLRAEKNRWELAHWGDRQLPHGDNGGPVVLSFKGGKVSGQAGCNQYSAEIIFGPDRGSLNVSPGITTRMVCDPSRMEFESAFIHALETSTRYRLRVKACSSRAPMAPLGVLSSSLGLISDSRTSHVITDLNRIYAHVFVSLTRYRFCHCPGASTCISTSYCRTSSQTSLLIAASPRPPASVLLNTQVRTGIHIMASMALSTCMTLGFPLEVRLGDDQTLPHPSGLTSAITQPIFGKTSEGELIKFHRFGSGVEAAKRFRSWLNSAEGQAGDKFLTMGLLFSFVHGGAIAGSLWWVWVKVGYPFHPAWIVAPLAMIVTADWTEHLIHLAQLRHYIPSHGGRMHNFWIQLGGCATMIKLWLTLGFYVSLLGLVVRIFLTRSERRLTAAAAE